MYGVLNDASFAYHGRILEYKRFRSDAVAVYSQIIYRSCRPQDDDFKALQCVHLSLARARFSVSRRELYLVKP